jgi:hypothetical protein
MDLRTAEAALQQAIEYLADKADVVLVREPLLDPTYPTTSDLDLLVFAAVDDILPERFQATIDSRPGPLVDLLWLPKTTLANPETLAGNGLIAHRLLGSRLVYDRTGQAAAQQEAVRLAMTQPDVRQKRLSGFFDMGFYTVREIGVTWDFPAMALFWVQIAYTAALAALLDAADSWCPNIYTRPFDYLCQAEQATGLDLRNSFTTTLQLDVDPTTLIAPLRRIHQAVLQQCPEPTWPANMRANTRYEYRYFLASAELAWRIQVAIEMIECGAGPAAVCYLRFMAYMVARLAMIYQRAAEGINTPFVRPAKAVYPDLARHCPVILDDLNTILTGQVPLTPASIEESLRRLDTFREQTLAFLTTKGFDLTELRPWRPFEPSQSLV